MAEISRTTTCLNALWLSAIGFGLILMALLAACDSEAPPSTTAPENAVPALNGTDASVTEEARPTETAAPTPPNTKAEPDREALVALFHAMDGPNWDDAENWLNDRPIGEWNGVTTGDNGRVTKLHIRSNQLSGKMPPELGSLSNLEALRLSENQLSGCIPRALQYHLDFNRSHLGGLPFC